MNSLPTLGINGFTTDKEEIMGRLYLLYLASLRNQSNIFDGTILSFTEVIEKYKTKEEFVERVTEDLKTFYGRYFKNVEVKFDIVNTADDLNRFNIEIITIDDEGVRRTLSKSIDNKINIIDKYIKEKENEYE